MRLLGLMCLISPRALVAMHAEAIRRRLITLLNTAIALCRNDTLGNKPLRASIKTVSE
jgi:hypothetical protein